MRELQSQISSICEFCTYQLDINELEEELRFDSPSDEEINNHSQDINNNPNTQAMLREITVKNDSLALKIIINSNTLASAIIENIGPGTDYVTFRATQNNSSNIQLNNSNNNNNNNIFSEILGEPCNQNINNKFEILSSGTFGDCTVSFPDDSSVLEIFSLWPPPTPNSLSEQNQLNNQDSNNFLQFEHTYDSKALSKCIDALKISTKAALRIDWLGNMSIQCMYPIYPLDVPDNSSYNPTLSKPTLVFIEFCFIPRALNPEEFDNSTSIEREENDSNDIII